jgi:hypothetical protein
MSHPQSSDNRTATENRCGRGEHQKANAILPVDKEITNELAHQFHHDSVWVTFTNAIFSEALTPLNHRKPSIDADRLNANA